MYIDVYVCDNYIYCIDTGVDTGVSSAKPTGKHWSAHLLLQMNFLPKVLGGRLHRTRGLSDLACKTMYERMYISRNK